MHFAVFCSCRIRAVPVVHMRRYVVKSATARGLRLMCLPVRGGVVCSLSRQRSLSTRPSFRRQESQQSFGAVTPAAPGVEVVESGEESAAIDGDANPDNVITDECDECVGEMRGTYDEGDGLYLKQT